MTLSLSDGRERLKYAHSHSRLGILMDMQWSVEWGDWLTLLGEEWSSCDDHAAYLDSLLEDGPFADVWEFPELGRRFLMTAEELEAFEALPDTFEVWRGCYANNKWGLSWSMGRAVAARFPRQHRYQQDGQPLLVRARVAKAKVLALKLDREEAEVITYRPRHVSTSHIRDRAPRRNDDTGPPG